MNTPDNQGTEDDDIRLIEAEKNRIIAYILHVALLLLIIAGFLVFLNGGGTGLLSDVSKSVVVLIVGNGIADYPSKKRKSK